MSGGSCEATMNEQQRIRIVVSGRVQGVCFRMYTCDEALRLGLTGWVRNRVDGTVEVLAEGGANSVSQLADWCHHGPPLARVTDVNVIYGKPIGEFSSFRITY